MNHKRRRPVKVQGHSCNCKMYKRLGNGAQSFWGSMMHVHPVKADRKRPDLVREGWADGPFRTA